MLDPTVRNLVSRTPSPEFPLPPGCTELPASVGNAGNPVQITEIRVHGVGGATPESLLQVEATAIRQVAGDRLAGFYRSDPVEGRQPAEHVEAYSWGGLTSRSRTRVLWIFLMPFMLANLAGWASVQRDDGAGDQKGPVHEFRLIAARWAGLGVTLGVLLIIATLTLNVLAYQCGGQPACATSSWWLAPLSWGDLLRYPSRRLVVGALVPLAVIGVLAVLSYTTRNRYEQIEPPSATEAAAKAHTATLSTAAESAPEMSGRRPSAAGLPGGLTNLYFWNGRDAHGRLTRAHVTAGIDLLAVILGLCAARTSTLTTGSASATPWLVAGLCCAGMSLVGSIALLTHDWPRQLPTGVALCIAFLALAAVVVFSWLQPPTDDLYTGEAPGIRLAFNLTWVVIGFLLLPLFGTFLARPVRLLARRLPGRSDENRTGTAAAPEPGTDRPARAPLPDAIGWIPPFAMMALGFLIGQVVLLGLLIFVAGLVSPNAEQPIRYSYEPPRILASGATAPIYLPPILSIAVSYIVWAGLFLILGFLIVFAVKYWLAGRGKLADLPSAADYAVEAKQFDEDYRASGGQSSWLYSAVHSLPKSDRKPRTRAGSGTPPTPGGIDRDAVKSAVTPWTRQRARWEFLARSPKYVSRFVLTVVTFAVALMFFAWISVLLDDNKLPPALPGEFATALAARIAIAIPPALFTFMVLSWRKLSQRRVLGTLWDVGTFWPRSIHPFAPPSYAERAVPELTRRVWWLNDNHGEVVSAAHSQGTVIAAATALRSDLKVDKKPRFGLVTFGSPLRKLYGRAFPAFWTESRLQQLNEPNGSLVVPGCWRNVYYLTDYIGGSVLKDPAKPRPTLDAGNTVDLQLSDPESSVYIYGQPPPAVRSHTGYWHDPRFRRIVAEMMAEVPSVTAKADALSSSAAASDAAAAATSDAAAAPSAVAADAETTASMEAGRGAAPVRENSQPPNNSA